MASQAEIGQKRTAHVLPEKRFGAALCFIVSCRGYKRQTKYHCLGDEGTRDASVFPFKAGEKRPRNLVSHSLSNKET